jgi:endonuclease YncB( thermonuclease family)
MMTMRSAALAAALALLSGSLRALAQEVPTVVDGDTIKFGHQRVRLCGSMPRSCGKFARASLPAAQARHDR